MATNSGCLLAVLSFTACTMLPSTIMTLLFSSLALVNGLAVDTGATPRHEVDNWGKKNHPKPPKHHPKPSSTCLANHALQTASYYTGLEEGTTGIRPGLSESKTDRANFINFCAGKTLTNGQQNRAGSCNGIPMGRIPATTNMPSCIILNPQPGDTLKASTTFNVTIQTKNLRAGYLVNPSVSYYTAPQDLDEHGNIIGHTHISIQEIGNLRTLTAPDPTQFAFFKGIDDAGDGKGKLTTEVTGGLPKGVYRVCTMIAARNHQPVAMPVAQRGAQDDCTKFVVE